MRKIILLTLVLFVWIVFGVSCRTSRTKDVPGIRRIISLSPNITETLYALGQQDKIVAVSDFCVYPKDAQNKETIGGLLNPNMEKMVYLQPDLIIGTPAHKELAARLQAYRIPSLLLANDRLADIFKTIDTLGAVLQCRLRADSLKRLISDSLKLYQRRVKRKFIVPPHAMLVIGREAPQLKNITVAGGHTFLSEIWTLMGGANIFADLPVKYAQINMEAIQQKNPDCIIEFKFKEKWNAHKQKENLKQWQALKNLQAAQNGHIFVLTADYTLIPGPRLYFLARDFLQIIKRFNKKD